MPDRPPPTPQPGSPETFVPDDPRLARVRRTSALQTVRARIVLAAHLGLLRPGEALPAAADLAEAFDVSLMTVRRALVSLADDGVVERQRGRAGGTRIAARPVLPQVLESADELFGHTEEVLALIEQRAALECGLVAALATRVTDAQLTELAALVEQMAAAADWLSYRRLDAGFHRGLARMAGLDGAAELHGRLLDRLHHFFLPYDMTYLHGSNQQHAGIVAALQRRDVGDAATRARAHVEELRDSMFMGRAEPTDRRAGAQRSAD